MTLNRIIHRYLFTEMLAPFAVSMVFLSFIFLMTEILEITNLVVNYRIRLVTILLMIAYSMPSFLVFIIPMAVMMGILLAFLRLSSDNEIMALRAGGVSLYALLPPAVLFCLLGTLLTALMTIYGQPQGRKALKQVVREVVARNLEIGLKPRTFNGQFQGVMLYVSEIDTRSKALRGIFIEDQRTQGLISTVVAPRGQLSSGQAQWQFQMRLYNGTVNQVNLEQQSVHTINFNTYDIHLDLQRGVASTDTGPKDEEEMSLSELQRGIQGAQQKDKRYYRMLMELHTRFSLPVACLALGLLAVPLGIQSRVVKRSYGAVLGLGFFLLYYLILSAGYVFGEVGLYPPAVGMWLPNVVMGVLGAFLMVQAAKDRRLPWGIWLNRFWPGHRRTDFKP
jgi:lipopolysaccharide export system permease protein